MGKVRIIGGTHRSRVLNFSDKIEGLRPTPDRVRETLFNWLGQDLGGKTCLDLFAGSGALGFEALSRHAKSVTMVESVADVVKDLRANQELLGATNLTISRRDAVSFLTQTSQRFDIIFIDPPYASNLLPKILAQLRKVDILNNGGVIYIEYKEVPDLSGYIVLKQKRAGVVNFALIHPE